ncbi:MAG TPA: DUF6520 family protein [Flavisolibacter sp.]|nr:DUF6520 family protein [Flavisolibacter sp.]
MKRSRIFMAAVFVLAIGSAFTTKVHGNSMLSPVYQPTGKPCQSGTLDVPPHGTCGVKAGNQCTITDNSGTYNAFEGVCGVTAINYEN